jgi:hypothetical protein
MEAIRTEEDDYPLADGPVEAQEPFVDPDVDLGYTEPPLEPIALEDPFANLAEEAQKSLLKQILSWNNLSQIAVRAALEQLMQKGNTSAQSASLQRWIQDLLNQSPSAQATLRDCDLEDLNRLHQNLSQLPRNNSAEDKSEKNKALRLLSQMLMAEGLRRHPN